MDNRKKYKVVEDKCNVIKWGDGNYGFQGDCCCNCEHQLVNYYHCTSATKEEKEQWEIDAPATTRKNIYGEVVEENYKGCICSKPKGFICVPPGFIRNGRQTANSNSSEHSLCELHDRRLVLDDNGIPEEI